MAESSGVKKKKLGAAMQLIGSFRKKNKDNLSNYTSSFTLGAKYRDMWEASYQGDVHWIRLHIEKPGIKVEELNPQGRNLLHECCRGGYVEVLRFLTKQDALDIPAMLREVDTFGFTPRALAKRRCYQNILDFIDRIKSDTDN